MPEGSWAGGGRRSINQVFPQLSHASSSQGDCTLPAPGISLSQHSTASSKLPGAKAQAVLWSNEENRSLDTKD